MRYRISKTRAREFAQKMDKICNDHHFIPTAYPIREGSQVKFYSIAKEKVIEGFISKSTYGGGENFMGESRNLHYFTVKTDEGFVRVRGKNLYPYLLSHTPKEI